jgi:hypothetical protein
MPQTKEHADTAPAIAEHTEPVDISLTSTSSTNKEADIPPDSVDVNAALLELKHGEPPETPEITPAMVRVKAMEMKNRRQEENAIKSMKLCGTCAIESGAAVGAVVSLKVDYRTHAHANGLLGIVYAVKEETGGILVCCEHGVITHSGTKADYWVPSDKYSIKAKRDQMLPLPSELQEVRDMVLAGKYNSEPQKRISYAKLHGISIMSSSPVKRGKGCTCRRGCKKSCGCKKNGFKCHSGCFCNGNCDGEI